MTNNIVAYGAPREVGAGVERAGERAGKAGLAEEWAAGPPDLDCARLYLREIRRKRLSDEEGRRTVGALGRSLEAMHESRASSDEARSTCESNRRRLVEGSLGLVVSVARRYQKLGLSLGDLVQEGSLGLMAAARRFEPKRHGRFLTYAEGWVRQAICRGLSQKARTIRIPLGRLALRRRMARVALDREQEVRNEECRTGRRPSHTTEDDAREIGVAPEVLEATIRLLPDIESLDAPSAAAGLPLRDQLADSGSPDPEGVAARSEELRRVRAAISRLPPRLGYILKRRYGLVGSEEAGLVDLGRELQVSAERVRQLQKRALAMLRTDLDHHSVPEQAARRAAPIKPNDGDGWERRPLVGTARRRRAAC